MMHLSATVQANFDYSQRSGHGARSCARRWASRRSSRRCSRTRPLYLGKPSGFISRRVHIWRHVDPDAAGCCRSCSSPGSTTRSTCSGRSTCRCSSCCTTPYGPVTVSASAATSREATRASARRSQDWNLHLTTLFPEVRLKQFLEVRGADAVPAGLTCALPALWKGILYDDDACQAAWRARRGLVLRRARGCARGGGAPRPRRGGRRPPRAAARARAGRDRAGGLPASATGAAARPTSVASSTRSGRGGARRSPGEEVLAQWEGAWRGAPERLIEHSRY